VIEVGQILAGKYRVERVLGKGGMGYVVAAFHLELGERVAVKFLIPELCQSEEPVRRFLREARAAVRIRNEHVARVLDVGKLETGAPYMVMEYLEGRDLADELERRGRLAIDQAVDYVLQASEAVAEAHMLGIVHRDLKPANLFLTRRTDGTALIKVLDFGISKAMVNEEGLAAPSLTATQALLGSPSYMSPEQVRKPKTVDIRTDIWAFGVILYELISGRQPFIADTPMSVLAAVVSDPTPTLRQFVPNAPPNIEAVIGRCLAKDPNLRFQSMAEFAEALAPLAPPLSGPSIARISGMLRASGRRAADIITMSLDDSNSGVRATAETVQATPPSMPNPAYVYGTPIISDSGSVAAVDPGARKHDVLTAAEWGASTKPSGERSRAGLLVATAIGAAVVAGVVVIAIVRPTGSTSVSSETSATATTVVEAAPAPAIASSTAPAQSMVAPELPPSASAPSAASSAPRRPPAPAGQPHRPAAPAPSAKPVQPGSGPSTVPDPLEGRR
jgi:serine/threonine-protein kinase